MRFSQMSDDEICGVPVEYVSDHGSSMASCMRIASHAGEHIALASDAAIADGCCLYCRRADGHDPHCAFA